MMCPLYEECPFVRDKLAKLPVSGGGAFGRTYCYGKPSMCARFVATNILGAADVPQDLSPTDAKRVERLIADH